MSNIMDSDSALCNLTRREVIEEMMLLRRSSIGNSILHTERTKLQKNVIRASASQPRSRTSCPEAGDDTAA